MIKKISSIKIDKKKIIVLGSALCVILVGILLSVSLGNKSNRDNTFSEVVGIPHKSGYAYDTKEDIERYVYQLDKKSDITYKLYGEVGCKNFSCMKESDKSYISVWRQECSDDIYSEICFNAEYIKNSTNKLSSEPYIVKNHYIVNLDNAYNSTNIYHMEGAVDGIGTFALKAYADLPEGTLISILGNDSSEFQVNIYDKETRIVIFKGAMYFRVPDLKGRILTVQVGNKIFKTSGNSEFLAYGNSVYIGSYAESLKETVEFFNSVEATKMIENIDQEEIYKNIGAMRGGIIPVNGEVVMLTRGATKEEKISKEYRFMYYEKSYKYKYLENPDYIDDPEKQTAEFLSIGKYFDKHDTSPSMEDIYGQLKDQDTLNKTEYGFGNIINGTNKNVASMMKKYDEDFYAFTINTIRDYNVQKASKSKCGSDFLDALDNCGCRNGWYYIKGKGCCPNGTTYDERDDSCVKQGTTTVVVSCPSGTHDVGSNLCCPAGYNLSADKKHCISDTGNKKSTPSSTTGGSTNGGSVTLSGTYVQNISNVIATGPCDCRNQGGKVPHTILFQNGIAYFDKDRGGNSLKYEVQGNIIYGIDSKGVKHDDGWRLNGNMIIIGDGKAKAVCTSSGGGIPNLCGFPEDGTYIKQ